MYGRSSAHGMAHVDTSIQLRAGIYTPVNSHVYHACVCCKNTRFDMYSHVSASPLSALSMECPLRGYGRAGTQNDRLTEAVILSTGTPQRGSHFEYQHMHTCVMKIGDAEPYMAVTGLHARISR